MRRWLWILLIVAASARLLLHNALMPPYAGLDEVYHVARLSFVEHEQRNPNDVEPSVAPYLMRSMSGAEGALPAFGVIGAKWPATARASKHLPAQRVLTPSDLTPYVFANYEAQQPSLYYSLVAPTVRLLPQRTALNELQLWRMFSLLCALVVVIATAQIGMRVGGVSAFIGALLVVSLPTWLTLVVRAGNDALACAFIAVGLAISLRDSRSTRATVVEAIVWALAVATKLYSWPIAAVLLIVWWYQRAPRMRVVLVSSAIVVSAVLTMLELHARTHNALGLFAFNRPSAPVHAVPIDFVGMLKVFIATAFWTSGQHGDALKPLGMLLYGAPLLIAFGAWWMTRRRHEATRQLDHIAITAVVLFFLAQCVNAAGYIRQAHASGASMPAGGKEAWYYFTLVPLLCGVVLTRILEERGVKTLLLISTWLIGWDLLISEGALYADYAGLSSPLHPNAMFRWGRDVAGSVYDAAFAVGPLAREALLLRLAHLLCAIVLVVVAWRNRVTSR